MSRSTDRSEHTADLSLVASILARHEHRATEPLVDVQSWLADNADRRLGAVLYVVWDRTDAAVLNYARPDLEVRVAAGLVNWARRREADAANRTDIPHPRPETPET